MFSQFYIDALELTFFPLMVVELSVERCGSDMKYLIEFLYYRLFSCYDLSRVNLCITKCIHRLIKSSERFSKFHVVLTGH